MADGAHVIDVFPGTNDLITAADCSSSFPPPSVASAAPRPSTSPWRRNHVLSDRRYRPRNVNLKALKTFIRVTCISALLWWGLLIAIIAAT
jgi:hypothetical protein